jgi:hypothetical protein
MKMFQGFGKVDLSKLKWREASAVAAMLGPWAVCWQQPGL